MYNFLLIVLPELLFEKFDIWSEGALYIMGFAEGLAACRGLLAPGGRLALTEIYWLRPDPPVECHEYFAKEYPAMNDIAIDSALIKKAGYDLIGTFTLPESAWWDSYYLPLEKRLAAFESRAMPNEEKPHIFLCNITVDSPLIDQAPCHESRHLD